MTKLEIIDGRATEADIDVMLLGSSPEDFEEAILGTTENPQGGGFQVVYLVSKVIDVFIERDGMTHDEAVENFEYNTRRSLLYYQPSQNPPVLVDDVFV